MPKLGHPLLTKLLPIFGKGIQDHKRGNGGLEHTKVIAVGATTTMNIFQFAIFLAFAARGVEAQLGAKWAGLEALPVASQAREGSGGGSKGMKSKGRKCGKSLKNRQFSIFPERYDPLAEETSKPTVGSKFSFDGDFFGSWTQTYLFLADGAIVQGHDTFEFFQEEQAEIFKPAGVLAVQFSLDTIVITAGTGIFACANGVPEITVNEDSGKEEIIFDICVCD